jgi:GGDEF domain-containing protein
VISIRKYLLADRQAEGQLLQLVQLLIEGVERHAVEGAPEDSARLRESTQAVLAAIESGAAPDELLSLGTAAMQALARNNAQALEYMRRPVAELQAKVKVLTAAVTAISSTSGENIRHLQQIKAKVLSSMDVRDIRTLRTQVSECLDGVLTAAERQRSEIESAAQQLKRVASPPTVAAGEGAVPALDPATGLPARAQAEEVIAQLCQEEGSAFVVVMAINRLEALTRSFGDQVGDAVLHRFAAFVQRQLQEEDRLFRWSGPTLVALLNRKGTLDTVRRSVDSLLATKIEHIVATATGEMKLPISSRWTVLPLMASPRLLFTKMDSFAGFDRVGTSEQSG